jgi:hypothetical protein
MLKRTTLTAAACLLAAGCAAAPDPAAPADAPSAAAPSAAAAAAAIAPMVNVAASSSWRTDERLLPQLPILALVDAAGSLDAPTGLSITCNPDTGVMTARLHAQPPSRAGGTATYRLRLGEGSEPVEGRFLVNSRTGAADFVFTLDAVRLKTMAQMDRVVFETDAGEPTWAFVRDAMTPVSAHRIGSLAGLGAASDRYLVFCNPK